MSIYGKWDWGAFVDPLLSYKGPPSWRKGQALNTTEQLVPGHLDFRCRDHDRIKFESFCFAAISLVDFSSQITGTFYTKKLIGIVEGQGADSSWIRETYLTPRLIRTVAYGLYFLDYIYRLSVTSQPFADGARSGPGLFRGLRKLLTRTSKGYRCLRVASTSTTCGLLLYSIAIAQITSPSAGSAGFWVFLGMLFRYCPVVLVLFSLGDLTLNLLFSSRRFAEWIYCHEQDIEHVTFRFQVDRWRHCEQSSSLGLDLGPASNSSGEGIRRILIYAPPNTTFPGESLPMSASRQEAKRQTPLFVRCDCCSDDHSAIDLASLGLVRTTRKIPLWSGRKRREQQVYGDFFARRKALVEFLPACSIGRSPIRDQIRHIENHRLCDLCTALAFRLQHDFGNSWLSKWLRGWTSARDFRLYRHLPNAISLATSAETCHLCAIFWQQLSTEQQNQLL
jgi:hypothetical protein